MSGSHYAPEPPSLVHPDESTQYDLRTATQHEAEDVARLGLRIDNLVDVCERQAQRIERLEAENRALREAVERHADLLGHYRAEAGI